MIQSRAGECSWSLRALRGHLRQSTRFVFRPSKQATHSPPTHLSPFSVPSPPQDAAGCHETGIVLKIETAIAFQNLPDLLLTAMRRPRFTVMVARGDLGVEVGFARLSEVQEEILWICEAGHVPVIWATQVLETFARSGVPTRAEVTDAAMGGRAEAVMLNKGPYMPKVLAFLKDILIRIGGHEDKKMHINRRLSFQHTAAAPSAAPAQSSSSKGEPAVAAGGTEAAAAGAPKRKKK